MMSVILKLARESRLINILTPGTSYLFLFFLGRYSIIGIVVVCKITCIGSIPVSAYI